MLRADSRFIPYDNPAPSHPIPGFLQPIDVNTWKSAAGYHLTCRRSAALREPFESRFVGYSPGEDSDMTYRLTRHGPIIARHDAYLHHLESPGSRFGLRRRTALGAINPLLCHRIHSRDLTYSKRQNVAMLRRRLVIELAKDLTSHDFTLPRSRGILYALRSASKIFKCSDEQLDAIFKHYQARS